jgi:hypothetical protein
MKRSYDRHFEVRQQLNDIAAGDPAENSILMLQRDDIEPGSVEELGRLHIVIYHLVANLDAHGCRVVVDPAGLGHGYDAHVQIWARICDGYVEIVREGSDSTSARQVIADERDTLEPFHTTSSFAPVCRGSL